MQPITSRMTATNKVLAYILSAILTLPTSILQAQEPSTASPVIAGKIVMVSGSVLAENPQGSMRPLTRHSEIFEGDTIVTATASQTQIRMVDQAIVSLKESTRFVVVRYNYTEETPAGNVSTLDLIEGGFRTISGRIGQLNRDGYTANAGNFATIGIRGTDYEVILTPSGQMFTGVYEGGTRIVNNFGTLDIGVGADFDFAEVPSPESPPIGLLVQPEELGQINLTVTDSDTDTDADSDTDNDNNNADTDNGPADDDGDADNNDASATPAVPAATSQPTPPAAGNNTQASDDTGNLRSADFVQPDTTTPALGLDRIDNPSSTLNLAARSNPETIITASVNPNEVNGAGLISCADNSASSVCRNSTGNGNSGGDRSNSDSAGGNSNSGTSGNSGNSDNSGTSGN
ncbi:MAG: FecR domain-containing protein, partial [Pseudohongiellaceae bacterium]